jgi:hypothetical protein
MMDEQNTCLFCGTPIPPAQKTGRVRLFCIPSHRAAWHSAQRQKALEDSIAVLTQSVAALDDAETAIEEAKIRISDQLSVLESLRQKPRRAGVLRASIPVDSETN